MGVERNPPSTTSERIELMAEDKKKRKLYDHPSSMKHHEGMSKSGSGGKGEDTSAEKKMAEKESKHTSGSENKKEMPMHERHSEERASMHKSHETERRDLHGNHREEHRMMHSRHEKAHKELMERHMAEMAGAPGGAGAPGNAPADAGAGAPAAAPPAPMAA